MKNTLEKINNLYFLIYHIMENTKQVSVKNCIKYIVFAGVIYTVLKVVPTTQLSNMEISVLICVILLGIFSLDCLTSSNKKKEKMTNAKMFDFSQTACTIPARTIPDTTTTKTTWDVNV